MASRKKSPAAMFEDLRSVSKLIGDLALNIADAQDRMDASYVRNLTTFLQAVREATADLPESEELTNLIKSLAPSRYQFTETTVEVRADLQMTHAEQFGLDAKLGYRTPVLAAAVNASYVKRGAYDYRASAFIRSVLHAVPADPGVMEKLLEAARSSGGAELPDSSRYSDLIDALGELPPMERAELPWAAGTGTEPEEENPELQEVDDELARVDAPDADDDLDEDEAPDEP